MAGSSLALQVPGAIVGARLAGTYGVAPSQSSIWWVPAHLNATGKFISQMCSFSVYSNDGIGKKDATGKPEANVFNIVVWGKRADAIAKYGSVGRALDLSYVLRSWKKPVVDAAGNPVMNRAGNPRSENIITLSVEGLRFREESWNTIKAELKAGQRPIGWDDRDNQAAQVAWTKIKDDKKVLQPNWAGGFFGCARIVMPKGQYTLADPTTKQALPAGCIPAATTQAGIQQNVQQTMNPAPSNQLPAGYGRDTAGNVVAIPQGWTVDAQGNLVAPAVGNTAGADTTQQATAGVY